MSDDTERIEQAIQADFDRQAEDQRDGESTMLVCPDCGGVLWQSGTGPSLTFRCHVGHAYAPELLASLKSEDMEAALWGCVRLLKEKAALSRQLATRSRQSGQDGRHATQFDEQADRDDHYVEVLKAMLELAPGPVGAATGSNPA